MEKSEPTTFLPFADDRHKIPGKKVGGGFIPTPNYTDITRLREANAELRAIVDVLIKRVSDIEYIMGIKQAGPK